jgi:hypothetical protein
VEKLNNWLTLIANLSVVAGIVFLAYEIRVNTNAVRSSAYAAYSETANSWAHFAGQHAEELAVIQQFTNLEALSEEQKILWMANALINFSAWEATYLHHRAGVLDQDVFEAKVRAFRNSMTSASPTEQALLNESWRPLKTGYSHDFQASMDADIVGAHAE